MHPGYFVRALNELAALTREIRRDECDAFISEMRQKDKPPQNKTIPERQKFRRIINRQRFRCQSMQD